MQKLRFYCGMLMFLYSLQGCKEKVSTATLSDFINDPENGYVSSKSTVNFDLVCKYLPTEFQVLNTLKRKEIAKEEFQQLSSEFGESQYYQLSFIFSPSNEFTLPESFITSPESFIRMISGSDTLSPVLSHAQTYGLRSKVNDVFLAFNCNNPLQSSTLEILIHPDSSRILIEINPSLRKSLPQIQLN